MTIEIGQRVRKPACPGLGAGVVVKKARPNARVWWKVLGLQEGALSFVDATMCEAKYRDLARKAHPDQGGSAEAMVELNRAREEMQRHFGAT